MCGPEMHPNGLVMSPLLGHPVEHHMFQRSEDMSEWAKWVHKVTKGASSREVGERIGRSHTTALRWMHDGASPEAVIALAIAYDADPIQAMVAAGWLRADLVGNLNLDDALRHLSTVKLTAELHRRATQQAERARGRELRSVFDEPR